MARVRGRVPAAGPAYSRALLDALDFLAGAPVRRVPASAFTTFRDLRRRLQMIRYATSAPRLSNASRAGLALLALALLLLGPVAVRANEDEEANPPIVVRSAPPEGVAPAPRLVGQEPGAKTDRVVVNERIAYVGPGRVASVLQAVLGSGAPVDRATHSVDAAAAQRFRDMAPLVSAPTVALLPGTDGVVAVGEERSAVTRYEVEKGEGEAARIADPVIETIHEGLQVRVNATPEGDGGRIRTRTEVAFTKLVSCEQEEIEVEGRRVQVERPVVRRSSVEATVSTTPDRDAWIVGPEVDGKIALVLLHAVFVPARK
jgi:hypothetical protein